MLTGRESLVRLIGRRRRSLLPDTLAAALSPSSPSPAASTAQANDGGASGVAAGVEAGPSSGRCGGVGAGAEWVSCPVCCESIRGSDYCVNTHLDICLTRGAKRKLTQSTLLNFRFSRKVSAEPTSNNLTNEVETGSVKQIDEDLSRDQAFFSLDSDIGSSRAGAVVSLPGCLNGSLDTSKTIGTYVPSNTVLPNVKDAVGNVPVEHCSSSMLPTVANSCSIEACTGLDSSTIVDTIIVGRRFHENVELREDAGITFLREPQNAKDSDAIKVLYAASECEEMLGYLPRELAKVLAPLMDKEYVECQGYVVGLPEQQLGNAPIQITVQKCKTDNQRNDDAEFCLSLWEKFVSTVKSGNFQQPSSTRYQTNFNSMISDVMANHKHVFSDIEKSFLDSFKSLSDDGQRLFVRIYTRKGPWFRKSTISYREISNLEHAAMELKCINLELNFACYSVFSLLY